MIDSLNVVKLDSSQLQAIQQQITNLKDSVIVIIQSQPDPSWLQTWGPIIGAFIGGFLAVGAAIWASKRTYDQQKKLESETRERNYFNLINAIRNELQEHTELKKIIEKEIELIKVSSVHEGKVIFGDVRNEYSIDWLKECRTQLLKNSPYEKLETAISQYINHCDDFNRSLDFIPMNKILESNQPDLFNKVIKFTSANLITDSNKLKELRDSIIKDIELLLLENYLKKEVDKSSDTTQSSKTEDAKDK